MPRQLSVAARARLAAEQVGHVFREVIRDGSVSPAEARRMQQAIAEAVDCAVVTEERHDFARMAMEASDGSRRFDRAVRHLPVIEGGFFAELGPEAA